MKASDDWRLPDTPCKFSNTPGGCPLTDCPYPHSHRGWKRSGKYALAEADKEAKNRKIVEVVKVPQIMVGFLIGKDGKNIKRVRGTTNTHIEFSNKKDEFEDCSITGTEVSIKNAMEMIHQDLANSPFKLFDGFKYKNTGGLPQICASYQSSASSQCSESSRERSRDEQLKLQSDIERTRENQSGGGRPRGRRAGSEENRGVKSRRNQPWRNQSRDQQPRRSKEKQSETRRSKERARSASRDRYKAEQRPESEARPETSQRFRTSEERLNKETKEISLAIIDRNKLLQTEKAELEEDLANARREINLLKKDSLLVWKELNDTKQKMEKEKQDLGKECNEATKTLEKKVQYLEDKKAKLAEELSRANMKIQQLEQKECLENLKLAKDLDDVKDQLEDVKQENFLDNKKRDDSDRLINEDLRSLLKLREDEIRILKKNMDEKIFGLGLD